MQYTTLGKTGLKVSVAGLGCGGNSRIGLGKLTEDQSVALVREAMDLGVNFLDTAENYETEPIVGKAIKGRPRDSVVISTKSLLGSDAGKKSGADMVACLDASLRKLDTDYVDIFHLHGLSPTAYDRAMDEIVPALLREKEKGKFRHLAVSETGPRDPEHKMLERAVEEPLFEVVMLAFHMMNQNARKPVLERAQRQQDRHAVHVRGAQRVQQAGAAGEDHRRSRRGGEIAAHAGGEQRPARLPGARGRRRKHRRCRLSLRAARARHRRRAVRHQQHRSPALQHRLDPAPAAAGGRRAEALLPCSAISSAWASTCRTGSRRRQASRKCRQPAKPAGGAFRQVAC